jgi:two-component system CheB/CheR fusion protein
VKGKQKSPSTGRADLRRRAEERRQQQQAEQTAEVPEAEVRRLLDELQVYQIELELQNEELRAARIEVEAGLARYTELFDFAPIGYVTLAPDETIRELNHAGARLLGNERRRLVGQRFADLLAMGQADVFNRLLGSAMDSEARETCEVELRRPGGARMKLRLSATVLAHSEPARRTILLAFEDITERIERERKLEISERALRDADRRKNEFLAVLSHELRNPLSPIRNSLYLLSHAEPGAEQARRAQAVIERQVGHMARIVDDLLDVTRIARGKVQLHRQRLDLGELVRSAMDDQRTLFETSGIRTDAHFDPGHFWVDADPVRMVQVLSNLLGNAEKFTPRGGRVVVSLQREGTKVSLRVRDTGVGVAPELAEQLFEPFNQAPQTIDRSRGGLGLGLAMTKGLVELHGGTVAIASEGPNRGTTVTVHLPLEAAPAAVESSVEPAPTRTRRVLVIEDNKDTADTLQEALAMIGHVVEVAYDGAAGIGVALGFRPEVVICDIGLPLMDGYEVARALRAEDRLRGTYLVALSGYGMPEDLERAAAAGFDRHVTKPFPLEELSRLISDAPFGSEVARPPSREGLH